jgi:hypothetical protein
VFLGCVHRRRAQPRARSLPVIVGINQTGEFEPLSPSDCADAFFALWAGLECLFALHVDLVTEPAVVNPDFRQSIEASRQALNAA